VGGHCIAVDPWFIVDMAPGEARMIRTAREVNDGKTDHVFERACRLIDENPGRPVICLGLAFKADVDDLRESPALAIVQRLARIHGERISVVEPFIDSLPADLQDRGVRKLSLGEALLEDGILILLVDHTAFRRMDAWRRKGAVVYDTKGIWR
jgi:UDP-N-acetyl-D-mannosaminuronic acid dehydrogenase